MHNVNYNIQMHAIVLVNSVSTPLGSSPLAVYLAGTSRFHAFLIQPSMLNYDCALYTIRAK